MPSHTFTRLGLWEESIRSNLAAAEVATGSDWAHAQDYLAYAYLQRGQQTAAKRVVDEVAQRAVAAPAVLALVFGHTLPPVRYVYERGRWGEAAALAPGQPAGVPWERFPQAEAVTHQGRAIGAARAGDPAAARDSLARLEALRDTLKERRETYWAEQVDIWRAEAAAWIAHAEGRNGDALQSMHWAADTEAKTDKHIVWPGPLAPAREMLGELLLAVGEPAQALTEFEASLANEPDRLRGLYGAGRAAELSKDHVRAAGHYRRLLEVTVPAEGDWPELAAARMALDAGAGPDAEAARDAGAASAWLPVAAAPVVALVAAGIFLVAFERRRRARRALERGPSRAE
jgi:tetratricopeptide (TPR) repeat protein